MAAHSSLRKISTACTTSVTPVLTATRSVTPAAGIAGAAASGAQDGIIGGGDGVAGRQSFGPSFSATSFPSPSAVYYDFWPLVRISFSSASSPPGPYFGPDYGYAPDYTGYLDSPDIYYGGGKAAQGCAASPSQMGRFETQWLAIESNLCALTNLSGQWIDLVHRRRPPRGIVLDIVPAMSTAPATGSAWI